MYVSDSIALSKLNLSLTELLMHRAAGNILYSERTDKYDIDSILQKRTITIGLQKIVGEDQKSELIAMMEKYSSLKRKLFSDMQKGAEYKNSGTDRQHRIIGKEYGFTNVISDSAFSAATGMLKSTNSWYQKTITALTKKASKLEEKIKDRPRHQSSNYRNGLQRTQKKLNMLQNKGYLPVWFGKQFLSGDVQNLEKYKKQRLELFVEGLTGKGNSQIRIEYTDSGYQLKLFKHILKIKIPKTHSQTFTLDGFNKQSCRIAYNKKGKLVLHITYSYIKPLPLESQQRTKGSVGIDIGPNEIAVCYVKNDGNPASYKHYSIGNLKDKRSADTIRNLSKVLDEILYDARNNGFYKITIENLNLPPQNHGDKKLNRLLSKFPREVFKSLIVSKSARMGLTLKLVNPAFTSIIGLFKYSYRDNLSDAHHSKSKDLSAALVIGRRGLGFQERAVVSVRGLIQSSIGIKSILHLTEYKSKKLNNRNSNWSLWKELKRIYNSPQTLTACLSANPNTN